MTHYVVISGIPVKVYNDDDEEVFLAVKTLVEEDRVTDCKLLLRALDIIVTRHYSRTLFKLLDKKLAEAIATGECTF